MSKTITITVFSKQRTANDGKKFKTYFTTMPGDEKAIKVKFREACGALSALPTSTSLRASATSLRRLTLTW